jgi:hypothetical protein
VDGFLGDPVAGSTNHAMTASPDDTGWQGTTGRFSVKEAAGDY